MNNKILITVIFGLTIIDIYLLSGWQKVESEHQGPEYTIPHLTLTNNMDFYGVGTKNAHDIQRINSGDIATGTIIGFVVYSNKSDQPKDVRQYYTIEATSEFDENDKQLFIFFETVKFTNTPAYSYEKKLLRVISDNEQFVTFESKDRQSFKINKSSGKVEVTDSSGYMLSLITNHNDFSNFIVDQLK